MHLHRLLLCSFLLLGITLSAQLLAQNTEYDETASLPPESQETDTPHDSNQTTNVHKNAPTTQTHPMLWLAIDDGSGPRIVDKQHSKVVQSALEQAEKRGFTLDLPAVDPSDPVFARAIWQKDISAIAHFGANGTATMQIAGKMFRSPGGWTTQWFLIDQGKLQDSWEAQNHDPRRAIASSADGIADALAKRTNPVSSAAAAATSMGTAQSMQIDGLSNGIDYIHVISELESNPTIHGMLPVTAQGQQLLINFTSPVDMDAFNRLLGPESVLVPVAPQTLSGNIPSPQVAEYRVK